MIPLAAAAVVALASALPPFTTGAKTSPSSGSQATLSSAAAGCHATYDRFVLRVGSGGKPGYDVRYVGTVYQDGSGFRVPLRGGAKLQIVVRAPAYDISTGKPTYTPNNPKELSNVTGYSTFRQVAFAGSFEGQTTIGLGVRARLPFRVFTLAGPGSASRLVVDVAHHW